jgi:beta-N-acetylhexosaminidase
MDGQRAIARRLVVGLPTEGLTPRWEKDFAMYPPAGVIVFARDFRDLDDLRRLTARLRELARPRRLFLALDEEGGWVSQLAGHLVVPPNAALLARGAGPGDLEAVARVTARRLRALGFDWDFAPVADVHSEPDNPVIGPRAYGTTPDAVIASLSPVLAGFRAEGLGSCLKHFPGHGDTRLDSHLALPVSDLPRATLLARECAPFRALGEADAVMSAHVVHRALDTAHPGTFSRSVLTTLLREELGFPGVCITDALEMEGAAAGRSFTDSGRLALDAGADLLLYAHWNEEVRRARLELADLLVDGGIDRAAFDAGRPRLMAFDRGVTEPADAALAAPLASLTPPDWEERLTAIIGRGLQVAGALAAPAVRVEAPEFAHGDGFAADLARAGLAVADDAPAQVIALASRRPLAPGALADLRRRCAERPTALVGLQNDAFLAQVPEAALRLSAADCTPLARRVVAQRLAALARV